MSVNPNSFINAILTDSSLDGTTNISGTVQISSGTNITGLYKRHIGLGLVDNTRDIDKPISNAVQTALDNILGNASVLATKPALDTLSELAEAISDICGNAIPDNSITTAKLADGAITANKIADGAITANKLAAGVLSGSSGSSTSIVEFNSTVPPTNNVYNIASGIASSNIYIKNNTFTGFRRKYIPFSADGIGAGLNAPCYAIAVLGTDLYVGGDFTIAGGINANRIAKYDTTSGVWSALRGGLDGHCYAIAVLGTNLYIGGELILYGGQQNVVRYDTLNGNWSPLGGGVNGICRSLAVLGTDLYVGGEFTRAGSSSVVANKIAKYDTTNDEWSALGDGINNICRSLAVSGTDLYVGGEFTSAGEVLTNKIAKYNTISGVWSALGSGLNGKCNAMLINEGILYAAGSFTTAGNVQVKSVAKYNISSEQWASLINEESPEQSPGPPSFSGEFFALALEGSRLYLCGHFQVFNLSDLASGIATLSIDTPNTNFQGLFGVDGQGNQINNIVGIPAKCSVMVFVSSNLYIGGEFDRLDYRAEGNLPTGYLAAYSNDYLDITFNSKKIATIYKPSDAIKIDTIVSGDKTYAFVTKKLLFYN